jgi:hypothetical protein
MTQAFHGLSNPQETDGIGHRLGHAHFDILSSSSLKSHPAIQRNIDTESIVK